MTRARFTCCAAALALSSWILACGGAGDPGPGTDPGTDPGDGSCGAVAELSDVGQAMAAAAPGMLARCVGFPEDWLTAIGGSAPTFDPRGVSRDTFTATVADRLEATRSSFELASLYSNEVWKGLEQARAVYELNESLGELSGGEKLRDDQKPVLRFLYTNPPSSLFPPPVVYPVESVFGILTGGLGPSPADWNVRVIVKRCSRDLTVGWNHSKLVIVDGQDATTTSFETDAYELALRLTGAPAALARAWFDEVFARSDNECKAGNPDDCSANGGRGPQAPTLPPPAPSPGSAVNVLSLPRGIIVAGENERMVTTADDALFAGIGATQERVFLLQPGLNGFSSFGASSLVSRPLVRNLAEAVARRGVDVKVVWGEPEGQFDLDAGWEAVRGHVESTLSELEDDGEITAEQAGIAACMIRVVPFGGMSPTSSHAKFYMLDDGFYVGSQNLYPSEVRLDPDQIGDGIYPDLDDHGFFVDASADVNHGRTDEVIERIVEPVWGTSASAAEVRSAGGVDCARFPHQMQLTGTFEFEGTPFTCTTGALAILDLQRVTWNEIADVVGAAVCHEPSSARGEPVTFRGSILVGGEFHGSLTWQGSSTVLSGTWTLGALNLTFGGAGGPSGTLVSGAGFVTISATSWGDPHLVTLDGLAYDFQAAGEFVAVESATEEPFTVQVRQQPWGSSRKVAVNTAVALQVGDDRVGVYAGRAEPLVVNGLATPMIDGQRRLLPGGGLVSRAGPTYAVEWPSGTGERVEIVVRGDHLDLRLGAPPFRRGGLRGLLGDFDGDPGDDVAIRGDGSILVSPTPAEFYGGFAESWRVTAAESLFDYAEGESTATFADPTFPDQVVTSRHLTDEQRAAAQLACTAGGVTDPVLLEACILDVALTGDGSFAAGAAATPPPVTAYEMFVNLAAGRPVTVTGTYAGAGPQVVTDGIYAPEGTVWNDAQYAITIPSGTSLTIDLGAVYSIREVVAQVDNNDSYLVETSTDGVDWSANQVTVPSYGGAGLRTRPTFALDPPVVLRFVRIRAASGDGSYSVSELELRGPTTPVGP